MDDKQSYLNIPGCEIILSSKEFFPVYPSRLIAILEQLSLQNPEAKVDFWIKITQ